MEVLLFRQRAAQRNHPVNGSSMSSRLRVATPSSMFQSFSKKQVLWDSSQRKPGVSCLFSTATNPPRSPDRRAPGRDHQGRGLYRSVEARLQGPRRNHEPRSVRKREPRTSGATQFAERKKSKNKGEGPGSVQNCVAPPASFAKNGRAR